MEFELVSTSVERTVALGRAVARIVQPGDVIALRGELGAGKTQWVRGLAEGLGADPRNVSSPTFVMMQEYATACLPVLHIDAYRIHSMNDLETTGWTTEVAAQSVSVIEWAGRIASELPADRLDIDLEHIDDHQRRIVMHTMGNFEYRAGLLTAVSEWRERSIKNGCKCPICGKEVQQGVATFPFCSARCKQVDLGRWFTGAYRIERSVDWANDDLGRLESGSGGSDQSGD
ncbi:MAG: tRNA (adenosine(37)-N6)-threonylcarbamoyltransferase complex ATPase subunit type 1 TsaE [Phycisphaerales bacterium]